MADRQGDYYDGGNPELYIQPFGPNTQPIYLGCAEVPGYDRPLGDITAVYCRGEQIMSSKGMGGRVTFTVSMLFGRTANALDDWIARGCRGQMFVNWYCRAQKGNFGAYERGTLFKDIDASAVAMDNMLQRLEGGEAGGPTHKTYTISAANAVQDYFVPTVSRKTFAGVHPLIDIAFCSEDECGGVCGPPDYLGLNGFVTPNVALSATSDADIWHTHDYGVIWAKTTTNPFDDGESAGAAVCFAINATTKRWVTGRATTDGANPAEIGYSDDGGVTWTNVNVGSTNGEFFPMSMSLFNLPGTQKIWGVTDTGGGAGGNIYYSADGGLTWTLQAAGADVLDAVHFMDKDNGLAVGEANGILFTSNGGTTWATITGPAAQAAAEAFSCGVLTRWRWIVGYNDGELWYTEDGGVNWLQRTLTTPAGWVSWNAVNAIDVVDESCIWLGVHYTGAAAAPWGAMLRSIDGGYTWEAYNATAACSAGGTGINGIDALGYNWAFGVGCLSGGTAMIMEVAV